jgi:hypothetical protein
MQLLQYPVVGDGYYLGIAADDFENWRIVREEAIVLAVKDVDVVAIEALQFTRDFFRRRHVRSSLLLCG